MYNEKGQVARTFGVVIVKNSYCGENPERLPLTTKFVFSYAIVFKIPILLLFGIFNNRFWFLTTFTLNK